MADREFEVQVVDSQARTYRVRLGGTVEPEDASVDWLAVVAGLQPVAEPEEGYRVLAFVREV